MKKVGSSPLPLPMLVFAATKDYFSGSTSLPKNFKSPSLDVPGAVNLSDDIIVHGKTQTDHDGSLRVTAQTF